MTWRSHDISWEPGPRRLNLGMTGIARIGLGQLRRVPRRCSGGPPASNDSNRCPAFSTLYCNLLYDAHKRSSREHIQNDGSVSFLSLTTPQHFHSAQLTRTQPWQAWSLPSEKMSAKRIMINPSKMLYIHLYCIQPNLYFGIITYCCKSSVELKCVHQEYILYILTYILTCDVHPHVYHVWYEAIDNEK
jgi:hypothetical protein